jgi:DNA-binding LytR/AlgR family response regulator
MNNINDIYYIDVITRYCIPRYHYKDKVIESPNERFEDIEERQKEHGFLMVDRGVVVNLSKVKEIVDFKIFFHDIPDKLDIARSRKRLIKEQYPKVPIIDTPKTLWQKIFW